MNNTIKRTWNQNSMVIIEDLQGMAFQAESGGHTFQISGIDGEGNAVALSGTPAGVMLRADGQDVTLTCSVSGGVVSATLPANAYSVPGRFGLTIFLTSDGQKTAIYAAVGTVGKTSSGTVAPPAGSNVVDLVNAIAAAVATIPASYTDLMAAMAPTYSSSGLYAVGSYAWYNGKLYRCTTAITSGETWTSGHWTLANLGSDLVDLKSAITATQNEFRDEFSMLLYGETVTVKSFIQGDRSSSDPYTTTQNLLRITVPYPITMRKGDKLTISCPSGKKIGVITSTGFISGFKTTDYTITATANFDVFIVMANSDTSTAITPSDGIAAGMTLIYVDNTSRLGAMSKTVDALDNNSGFFIDKSLINIPGYTVNNGRIYSSSSDTKRSEFIRVTAGTKIAYRLSGIAAFNLISFYTDKSATASSAPSYVSGVAGDAAGTYTQGIFTVPQDGYVVFTNMTAYQDIYVGNVDGLYGIDQRLDNLEQSSGVTDLTGKYILNFGDSLANGAGNSNKSYADMIASETNGTLADYSVSGTPFANYGQSDDYACVYNQVRQAAIDHASHDVAICLVEGAINDLKRNVLDLGTLSDNYDGTYAKNMIIGTAEYIFYTLKNAFPNAKIVFVMYHQMPLKTDNITYVQMHGREDQEHEAFIAVCNKWSIPIADVYSEGALNSNIQAMAETYFGVDASEKFGRDVAHPNALGYRKFYVSLIKQKLELSTYE